MEKVARALDALRGVQRTFFSASLPTYFFWSMVFYAIAGTWCIISMPALKAYLCGIFAEDTKYHKTYMPTAQKPGLGCTNCTDIILTCGKSDCVQAAFGRSYTLYGTAAPLNTSHTLGDTLIKDSLQEDVLDAIQDVECNKAITSASTVHGLVLDVISKQATAAAANDADGLTAKCVRVMCQNLYSLFQTSNASGTPVPTTSTIGECAAEAVWSISAAKTMLEACAQFSEYQTVLSGHAYERIITTKNQCMQPAIDNAKVQFAGGYASLIDISGAVTSAAFTDRATCFSLLSSSNDLVTLVKNIKGILRSRSAPLPQPGTATFDNGNVCGGFFCNALFNAGTFPNQATPPANVITDCTYTGAASSTYAIKDIQPNLITTTLTVGDTYDRMDIPTYCNEASGGSIGISDMRSLLTEWQAQYTANLGNPRRRAEGVAVAGSENVVAVDHQQQHHEVVLSLKKMFAESIAKASERTRISVDLLATLGEALLAPSSAPHRNGDALAPLAPGAVVEDFLPLLQHRIPDAEERQIAVDLLMQHARNIEAARARRSRDERLKRGKQEAFEQRMKGAAAWGGTESREPGTYEEQQARSFAVRDYLPALLRKWLDRLGVSAQQATEGDGESLFVQDLIQLVPNLYASLFLQDDPVFGKSPSKSRIRSMYADRGAKYSSAAGARAAASRTSGSNNKDKKNGAAKAPKLVATKIRIKDYGDDENQENLPMVEEGPSAGGNEEPGSATGSHDRHTAHQELTSSSSARASSEDSSSSDSFPPPEFVQIAEGKNTPAARPSGTSALVPEMTMVVPAIGTDTTDDGADEPFTQEELRTTRPTYPRRAQSNDDLDDYEEGDWSLCNCCTMCMPGLQTRKVDCFASACAEPKPATKQACECTHCADCQVLLNLLIIAIFYFVQGGVALIVWLGFLYWSGKTQDDLVGLSIPQKCLACMCKKLPTFVRLLTLIMFFQLSFLATQAFMPYDVLAWQMDCKFPDMWTTTSLVAAVWTVQLILGVMAKVMITLPPYLFTPISRKTGFLVKLLRGLGP